MNLVMCLDDKDGILFNNRRQSRDQAVCERVLELAKDSVLWGNWYSAKLFPADKVKASENFLDLAEAGEYCFVENLDFLAYSDKIEKVIVYRWNKVYPLDVKVDKCFWDGKKLVQSETFSGNSHEKITQEIYL